MSEELISVIDVANHHGKRKQTIFKILRRLGIEARKIRGANHGQFLSIHHAGRIPTREQ